MEKRLYGLFYNVEQWDITEGEDTLIFFNKATNTTLKLSGDIIGLEQITDSTFLIHQRIANYDWQIARVKFENGTFIEEFKQKFHDFDFLTDDTIMFDNKMVYSISRNAEVEEFSWIANKYDVFVYNSIKENKVLFLEYRIKSRNFPCYIMVIVDSRNFKPVTKAYSTLRDSTVTLSDGFTFDMLKEEDERFASIISNLLFQIDNDIYNRGVNTLLNMCPIIA